MQLPKMFSPTAGLFGLLVGWVSCIPAVAQPSAHFTLRPAPGVTDATLVLGDANDDTLEMEVWVELFGVAPGVKVWAISLFLDVSSTGVITYSEDWFSPPFSPSCVYNATNNAPDTGDFSPACFSLLGGVTDGIGAPALYGAFSVQAVAPGAADYIFFDDEVGMRPWSINLSDMTSISGANLSFSIDPAVAVIEVVEALPNADVDDDGDVDLADYRTLQECQDETLGARGDGMCARADINADQTVDTADVNLLVSQITGVRPPKGSLDRDLDVDLVDYGRFQVCLLKWDEPAYVDYCADVDVNRDGSVSVDDYAELGRRLTGP